MERKIWMRNRRRRRRRGTKVEDEYKLMSERRGSGPEDGMMSRMIRKRMISWRRRMDTRKKLYTSF